MIISVICGLITVVALIILIVKLNNDKLDFYNIKILEAEDNLQTLLEKKFSLLSALQQKFSEQNSEVEFNLLCDTKDIEDDEFMLNAIENL